MPPQRDEEVHDGQRGKTEVAEASIQRGGGGNDDRICEEAKTQWPGLLKTLARAGLQAHPRGGLARPIEIDKLVREANDGATSAIVQKDDSERIDKVTT